jgi:hypothetical protein
LFNVDLLLASELPLLLLTMRCDARAHEWAT